MANSFTDTEITQLVAATMPPPPPPAVSFARQQEFAKLMAAYTFTVPLQGAGNITCKYVKTEAPPEPKCPDCGSKLKQCDHFVVCTSTSCVFIKSGRLEDMAMMEAPF